MRGCMVCLSIEKETVSEASGVILYNKFDNQKSSKSLVYFYFTFLHFSTIYNSSSHLTATRQVLTWSGGPAGVQTEHQDEEKTRLK